MPIGAYYGGRGEKVAAQMRKRYGPDWRRVFYATANKTQLKPGKAANRTAALHAMRDDLRRRRGR